jgi:hypothetical protein
MVLMRCHWIQNIESKLPNLDAGELLRERKWLLRTVTKLNSSATAASFDFGLLKGRMARALELLESDETHSLEAYIRLNPVYACRNNPSIEKIEQKIEAAARVKYNPRRQIRRWMLLLRRQLSRWIMGAPDSSDVEVTGDTYSTAQQPNSNVLLEFLPAELQVIRAKTREINEHKQWMHQAS